MAALTEPKEPKVKWKDSEAQSLLLQDLYNRKIPLNAKDDQGKSTMKLKEIYLMRPEFSEYFYAKFSSCLSTLRDIVKKNTKCAADDNRAMESCIANHEISYFSTRGGYIQWKGSSAQKLLLEDI